MKCMIIRSCDKKIRYVGINEVFSNDLKKKRQESGLVTCFFQQWIDSDNDDVFFFYFIHWFSIFL